MLPRYAVDVPSDRYVRIALLVLVNFDVAGSPVFAVCHVEPAAVPSFCTASPVPDGTSRYLAMPVVPSCELIPVSVRPVVAATVGYVPDREIHTRIVDAGKVTRVV